MEPPFKCNCDGLQDHEKPCGSCIYNLYIRNMRYPAPRTGRTERMLREIAKLVEAHQPCHVVAYNQSSIEDMRGRLIGMVGDRNKVFNYVNFHTLDTCANKVDIKSGRSRTSSNVATFADHHVFESECWWLFEQWQKWNNQEPE